MKIAYIPLKKELFNLAEKELRHEEYSFELYRIINTNKLPTRDNLRKIGNEYFSVRDLSQFNRNEISFMYMRYTY